MGTSAETTAEQTAAASSGGPEPRPRSGTLGVLAVGLGAVGATVIATDDVVRFSVGSPLIGPTMPVIGGTSALLTLLGGAMLWRSQRGLRWIAVAVAVVVQLLGRMGVGTEGRVLYAAVSVAHAIAPALMILAGELMARRATGPAVRWLGRAVWIAAACWLLAGWTPVPLVFVPLMRAVSDALVVIVIAWPALGRVAAGVQGLWDSAEVR